MFYNILESIKLLHEMTNPNCNSSVSISVELSSVTRKFWPRKILCAYEIIA